MFRRSVIVPVLVAFASACTSSPSYGPFEPYVFDAASDPIATRLCTYGSNPDLDPDPLHPTCRSEGEDLVVDDTSGGRSLRVLAYNLERGYQLDGQLAWLASADGPRPDVVVLTEADRGCTRTGRRHVAREWAEALSMDYVFAVEFEEVSFDATGAVTEVCEHGDAILSRVPIGNVRTIRYATTDDWTSPPGTRTYPTDARFGGRVAIRADLAVGGRRLRLYGTHLASGAVEDALRKAEVDELLVDAEGISYPILVVGDLNTHLYKFDLDVDATLESVTQTLFAAGFVDSHASIPTSMRTTDLAYDLIIDLALGRGVRVEDPWIGDRAALGTLSDHLPIATTVRF